MFGDDKGANTSWGTPPNSSWRELQSPFVVLRVRLMWGLCSLADGAGHKHPAMRQLMAWRDRRALLPPPGRCRCFLQARFALRACQKERPPMMKTPRGWHEIQRCKSLMSSLNSSPPGDMSTGFFPTSHSVKRSPPPSTCAQAAEYSGNPPWPPHRLMSTAHRRGQRPGMLNALPRSSSWAKPDLAKMIYLSDMFLFPVGNLRARAIRPSRAIIL